MGKIVRTKQRDVRRQKMQSFYENENKKNWKIQLKNEELLFIICCLGSFHFLFSSFTNDICA